VTLAETCELLLLSRGAHATVRFFEIESTGANPHAVQDDGELAGERYLRLLHAGALGESHRPALERAAVDRPRQDDMSGLIENGAHRTVTYLANSTADVGFA
jgi:hypothetical protein